MLRSIRTVGRFLAQTVVRVKVSLADMVEALFMHALV